MDKFCEESSINGVEFFHSSQSKSIKRSGILTFFIAFCGLSFYIFQIYINWRVDPVISEEVQLIPLRTIPFPAITFCNPIFSRDQTPNLYEVLQNPHRKLSVDEQNSLAANVQACAPDLADKIIHRTLLRNSSNLISILKGKFLSPYDSFVACSFRIFLTDCLRMLNYVLTDKGFCFNVNLEGFYTLFNEDVIADDFKSYMRLNISQIYDARHPNHKKLLNDKEDQIEWNIERKYFNNSAQDSHPVRLINLNKIAIYGKLNISDLSNLCPNIGKVFTFFYHMPNEIITPFHMPRFIQIDTMRQMYLQATYFTANENLRVYSPEKRGCYFQDERKLKFFKAYTKFQCQFECMANLTLKSCGCVRFSMPRNNSTPICDLDKVACYLNITKKWPSGMSTCNCLDSCFYIEYKAKVAKMDPKFVDAIIKTDKSALYMRLYSSTIKFSAVEREKYSTYGLYNVFSDLGSMLGIFFGCSVISVIEIFYFISFHISSRFCPNKNPPSESSNCTSTFASESTIHGVQFIFDNTRSFLVRSFWTVIFIVASVSCVINSKECFIKWRIIPVTDVMENQKSSGEIPFPGITFCPGIFAKNNLADFPKLTALHTMNPEKFRNETSLKSANYFIANLHACLPLRVEGVMKTMGIKSDLNVVEIMNQSKPNIDEIMHTCKLQNKLIECSKIFKRVLSRLGFCFRFNSAELHDLFTDEISSDFYSYGKGEKSRFGWTLDGRYESENKNIFPIRASSENSLKVTFKVSQEDAYNQCPMIGKGFFTILHATDEVNEAIPDTTFIEYSSAHKISLTAKSKVSDANLRSFTPQSRGCYFQNEKQLKFFKIYTKINCEFECLGNRTLEVCGCVPFLLTRDEKTKVCSKDSESSCYFEVMLTFPKQNETVTPCECWPTCNYVDYEIKENLRIKMENEKEGNFSLTQIELKFIDDTIQEELNFVAYGFKDFITDVGGLLGLFLGCSMISLGEFIYHPWRILHEKFNKVQSESEKHEDLVEETIDVESLKVQKFLDAIHQIHSELNH